MEINSLLDSLYQNKGQDIVIVYPNKWDLEDYVFDLESQYSKKYGERLSNVQYTQYRPNLSTSRKIIIDSRCYQQQIKEYENVFEEMRKLLCKTLNKA